MTRKLPLIVAVFLAAGLITACPIQFADEPFEAEPLIIGTFTGTGWGSGPGYGYGGLPTQLVWIGLEFEEGHIVYVHFEPGDHDSRAFYGDGLDTVVDRILSTGSIEVVTPDVFTGATGTLTGVSIALPAAAQNAQEQWDAQQ